MVLKIPPPPPIANSDPVFNRWLLELTNILNGGGTDLSAVTAPTQPPGTNNTTIATTAFVAAASASSPSNATPLMDATPGLPGTSTAFSRGDHVHPTDTSRAPLASPTFTGTPQAPTAAPGANNNVLATTAFVATSFAPLASPTFTGTPAAPTAAPGTNTAQLATTAFVQAAVVAGSGLGVAKAWVKFAGQGANGACVVNASFNVSGVTRSAAGVYTVTFTSPFASADYACNVTQIAGASPAWGQVQNGGMAAGSVQVGFVTAPLAGSDPGSGMVVCFGT